MKTIVIAAVAAFGLAQPSLAQTAPAKAQAPSLPLIEGVQASPDCGGVALGMPSVCVTTALVNIQPVFDAYVEFLKTNGWVGGAVVENGLVMSRPRDGGSCDVLQVIAFQNPALPVSASTPGYIAFAPVPGARCTGAPAQ